MRLVKAFGWLVLFLSVAFVLAGVMIAGITFWFARGMCREWVSVRVLSPDRRRTAVLRHTDCGATTSVSSFVEIEPGGTRVFSSDGAVRRNGEYGLDLHWRDANTLEISYHRAHWSEMEKQSEIVVIEQRDLPPDRP